MASKSRLLHESVRDIQNARTKSKPGEWTARELKIVESQYRELGAVGVHKLLPDRSINAIRNIALKLGVRKWKHNDWGDEEIDIIKKYYPIIGPDLMDRLPGRTRRAIAMKASDLRITCRWTQADLALLKKYYPRMGSIGVHSLIPYKSKTSIGIAARKIGLRRERIIGDGTNVLQWTQKERELLSDNQNLRLSLLIKLFPDRTRIAVKQARQKLRSNPAAVDNDEFRN